nr:immunoglobulin light chain junction region [Macaca mulatta]
CLQALDFPLTF